MRPLEDLSGPWAGWWMQDGTKGEMTLALEFADGRVRGHGRDPIGGFQISGMIRGASVDLLKGYPLETVRYRGVWDGSVVSGEWRIGSRERTLTGPFELWPVGDELSMEGFMAEESLTLAGAEPTSPISPRKASS